MIRQAGGLCRCLSLQCAALPAQVVVALRICLRNVSAFISVWRPYRRNPFPNSVRNTSKEGYLMKSATGYIFFDEKKKRWVARFAPVDKVTGKQKEFKRLCLTKTEARKKTG